MRDPRHVLVLAAHADDETLGCGGTIAKLARTGWQVEVVIVSDGVVTARETPQDNREDAAAAAATLGVAAPRFLGFPDQRLDQVAMVDLSQALLPFTSGPDLVLTHASTDLNVDHRLVSEAARVAFRPIDRAVSILEFETPGSSQWNGQAFAANYYVDISDTLETKVAALAAYSTEARPPPHPFSGESVRHLARHHGSAAATAAAEAFRVIRGFEGQLP